MLLVWLRWLRGVLRRDSERIPQQLADSDSQFVDVGGIPVHYKQAGHGQPTLVLLHGSFLSILSWREVMQPLAQYGRVVAFDRPAFGLTARTLEPFSIGTAGEEYPNAYSPEAQADLTAALLERLGIERAILVGSSTGGTLALLTALRHPQRVQALVLVGAMVYSGYPVSEVPGWLLPLLNRMERSGPLMARVMIGTMYDRLIRVFWHDPRKLPDDVLAHYRQTFQVQQWDRALWRLILATHALELAARLRDIRVPALVVTGDQDRTVPTEQSIRLAQELPDARLVIVPECGHLPHEECPQIFLQSVTNFLSNEVQ